MTAGRILWIAAAGALTLTAACNGGAKDVAAPATPTGSTSSASHAAATKLDVDPCTLLTLAEIEAAIGSGATRGGFGTDLPGRCTFSIGGDVGAGVVAISNDDPLTCSALQRALDAGSLEGTGSIRVDVGNGGVAERAGGSVSFAVGGGCLAIHASTRGVGLSSDAMVVLAKAAAGRVG
jgi:hypothetical protein